MTDASTPDLDDRNARRIAKWKAAGEPRDVAIVDRDGASTRAVVYRKDLSDAARTARAAGALATCWALAVVSVLLPIAHFVLVPGFLIAGPIVAWRRHAHRSVVLGGIGTCPRCQKPVRVKKASEDWPLGASCDACLALLQVTPSTWGRGES